MVLLKIIENGNIRYIICEILLAFHCGPILYRFRDKTIYWSKVSAFDASVKVVPVGM